MEQRQLWWDWCQRMVPIHWSFWLCTWLDRLPSIGTLRYFLVGYRTYHNWHWSQSRRWRKETKCKHFWTLHCCRHRRGSHTKRGYCCQPLRSQMVWWEPSPVVCWSQQSRASPTRSACVGLLPARPFPPCDARLPPGTLVLRSGRAKNEA